MGKPLTLLWEWLSNGSRGKAGGGEDSLFCGEAQGVVWESLGQKFRHLWMPIEEIFFGAENTLKQSRGSEDAVDWIMIQGVALHVIISSFAQWLNDF